MVGEADSRKERVQDVESLFQTVITVSIFFITVIDILFRYANSSVSQIGTVELLWMNMPVAFIISYIVLLIELGLIAVAATFVISNGNDIHSYAVLYSFRAALWCAGTVPTITLLLLGLGSVFFRKK